MTTKALVKSPIAKAVAMTKKHQPLEMTKTLDYLESFSSDFLDYGFGGLPLLRTLSADERENLSEFKKSLTNVHELSGELFNINLRHQFPKLPLKPLTWCDENGWPKLAPFHLDNPRFALNIRENSFNTQVTIHPSFPLPIQEAYEANNYGAGRLYPGNVYLWETFFPGLIPSSIVPIIKQAKPLFEDIFIIAEVSSFILSEWPMPKPKPKPIDPDPLIVGYYDGQLYLIAAFDLSPMEEAYIANGTKGGVKQLERSQDCIMLHQIAGLIN